MRDSCCLPVAHDDYADGLLPINIPRYTVIVRGAYVPGIQPQSLCIQHKISRGIPQAFAEVRRIIAGKDKGVFHPLCTEDLDDSGDPMPVIGHQLDSQAICRVIRICPGAQFADNVIRQCSICVFADQVPGPCCLCKAFYIFCIHISSFSSCVVGWLLSHSAQPITVKPNKNLTKRSDHSGKYQYQPLSIEGF